ncbi:hypothetical protein AB4Y89_23795 [Terriglobus sp. 2YAB30_2]|uniref:hypothetical protein n=1 Tax=unclassified Terriglobus TaxID=2628988 RepID=UPI003F999F88
MTYLRLTHVRSALAVSLVAVCTSLPAQVTLQPKSMPRVAQVDPRYVSFNVEAIEITGGRFWKPFPKKDQPPAAPGTTTDPYQYRPPIDLSRAKIRKLAGALAPSYMRVSGTWRNSTYFQDDDAPQMSTPPTGFKGVMTRAQWKGAIDFAHAVGADLVTSVAISDGTRDANGDWTTAQAKTFFDFTRKAGGHIAATEFLNEPTFAAQGAAPKGYDEAAFAKDVKAFRTFLKAESPETIYLGPGSIGEGVPMIVGMPMPKMLSTEKMLQASGPVFDAFSYHVYTTLSPRCVGKMGLSWEKVLTPAYLDRNPDTEAFYAKLRDTYMPGKQIWLTESGEAGCGGSPWASTFIDTFRFADQLGSLARRNVQTVMVNTLASSDYGLLNEETLNPRPDYWLALLWKRLMGTTVLDPGPAPDATLRIYAHCMKDAPGGVSVVALNIDKDAEHAITLSAGERYTLTAPELLSETMMLNGKSLQAEDGTLPTITGERTKAGEQKLPPASITFFTVRGAGNVACREGSTSK